MRRRGTAGVIRLRICRRVHGRCLGHGRQGARTGVHRGLHESRLEGKRLRKSRRTPVTRPRMSPTSDRFRVLSNFRSRSQLLVTTGSARRLAQCRCLGQQGADGPALDLDVLDCECLGNVSRLLGSVVAICSFWRVDRNNVANALLDDPETESDHTQIHRMLRVRFV